MSCKTLTELITLYSYKGRGYPSGCFEENVPFVHNCALRTQGPGIWCSLGFHVCCFFLFEYTDLLTLLKRFTEQFVGSHWRTLLVCAIAMDVALLYSSISSGGSGCNLQFSCTCWQLQWNPGAALPVTALWLHLKKWNIFRAACRPTAAAFTEVSLRPWFMSHEKFPSLFSVTKLFVTTKNCLV